jgi:hypothetical protein
MNAASPCGCKPCRVRARIAQRRMIKNPLDAIAFDNDGSVPFGIRVAACLDADLGPCNAAPTCG